MTTQKIQLSENWAEIGAGPLLIEAAHGAALVHFGASAPDPSTDAYHRLGAGWPRAMTYSGTTKVYARTGHSAAALIVTGLT